MFGGLFTRFDTKKIKPQLKMASQRIKLLNNKKAQETAREKRAVAQLIEAKKYDKARIRVEAIIRKDREMEANEILDLMCELVHERATLMKADKECPPDLLESVSTLIWASDRTPIAELREVRKQLVAKYGDEFSANARANRDPNRVNNKVFHRLTVAAPDVKLITTYLQEIAAQHGLEYSGDEHSHGSLLDAPLEGTIPTEEAAVPSMMPPSMLPPSEPTIGAPPHYLPGHPPAGPGAPGAYPPAGGGYPPQYPPAGPGGPGAPGAYPQAGGYAAPPPAAYPTGPAPGSVPPMMPPAPAPYPSAGPPPSAPGPGPGPAPYRGEAPPSYAAPAAYPSVPPPSGPTDFPAPPAAGPGAAPGAGGGGGGGEGDVPSFEDLTSRFAALKKR